MSDNEHAVGGWALTRNVKFGVKLWHNRKPRFEVLADLEDSTIKDGQTQAQWERDAELALKLLNGEHAKEIERLEDELNEAWEDREDGIKALRKALAAANARAEKAEAERDDVRHDLLKLIAHAIGSTADAAIVGDVKVHAGHGIAAIDTIKQQRDAAERELAEERERHRADCEKLNKLNTRDAAMFNNTLADLRAKVAKVPHLETDVAKGYVFRVEPHRLRDRHDEIGCVRLGGQCAFALAATKDGL